VRELGRDPAAPLFGQHEDVLDLRESEVRSAPGDMRVSDRLSVLPCNEVSRVLLDVLTEAAERQMAINRRNLTWLQSGHRNHETKSHTGSHSKADDRRCLFRRARLEDEKISVLAGDEGDRIVAAAIANRSSTVIGLSNLFDVTGDLESGWVTAAAIAASLWGQMTTAGYDSGDSLEAAHRAGSRASVNLWCG
jgi:hypothetical protein